MLWTTSVEPGAMVRFARSGRNLRRHTNAQLVSTRRLPQAVLSKLAAMPPMQRPFVTEDAPTRGLGILAPPTFDTGGQLCCRSYRLYPTPNQRHLCQRTWSMADLASNCIPPEVAKPTPFMSPIALQQECLQKHRAILRAPTTADPDKRAIQILRIFGH